MEPSYKGYTFPKTEYTKTLDAIKTTADLIYTEKEREEINNLVLLKMQPIKSKIKLIGCKRLEDLEERKELLISNLSAGNYRGMGR